MPDQSKPVGPEIAALRQEITELVARNAIAMVQSAIDAVNDGQYQVLKYLFEIVGLYPASVNEGSPGESSLAEILLQQLGIDGQPHRQPSGEASVANRGKNKHPDPLK